MNWYDALMKYVNPNRKPLPTPSPSPEPNLNAPWREKWAVENAREAEGIFAGMQGMTREDCPYDHDAHPLSWNFWVYGCENAGGELATIQKGEVDVRLYTTGAGSWEQPPIMMPLADAIKSGQWKPRYFSTQAVFQMLDSGTATVTGGSSGITVSGGNRPDNVEDQTVYPVYTKGGD